MRSVKLALIAICAVMLWSGSALAFHDAGVAYCSRCHTMHNSEDGAVVADGGTNAAGNAHLLNWADATSACLSCHASYGQFYGGEGYGPGGDFYWLTKTYGWSAHGSVTTSEGDNHGHNVISDALSLTEDATLTDAPGGDFLSSRLSCTSCHDPHGNTNFRILYGSDLGPIYNGIRFDFDNPAPIAEGNSRRTYSGSGGDETNSQHTIYKSGMSEWCANCHTDFHSPNTTNFVHATGQAMGSTIAGIYNAYVSSDDLNSGDQATSYFGLVPFEAVNVDLEVADSGDYTEGPDGTDKVMCLTCHRAHAGPFDNIGRWDFHTTFLAEAHPQITDDGATAEDIANMWYDYTFVANQRSLCNKCHAKDFGDGPL